MSSPSLARRERHALCDLALTLGPDAPTLCGDWTVAELVAHLLVRETQPARRPPASWSRPGGLTERGDGQRTADGDFPRW